jgi:DNA-binding CsgD family transcriptional regulator
MEKVSMRSPALVPIERPEVIPLPSIQESVRSILGILATHDHSPDLPPCGSGSEEVLMDTEVDGYRYLLVRMPLPDHGPVRLSPREQEIVRMVAKGHPNKVIADVLSISSWTVCTHLRRIFAKLGVGSRAAMVAQLLQMGAIAPENPNKPRRK